MYKNYDNNFENEERREKQGNIGKKILVGVFITIIIAYVVYAYYVFF